MTDDESFPLTPAEPNSPAEPEPTIDELIFWIDSSFVSMPMLDDPVKRAAIHAILDAHRERDLGFDTNIGDDDLTR